jgi:putative component of toxin-antitoxin plasmid stabilization module
MEKNVVIYKTKDNKTPFSDWLFSLRDVTTRERIETRIDRMLQGNYGDHKRFKGIYCGEDGNTLIVLLVGGDKGSQEKDIKKALEYWEAYHEQK